MFLIVIMDAIEIKQRVYKKGYGRVVSKVLHKRI